VRTCAPSKEHCIGDEEDEEDAAFCVDAVVLQLMEVMGALGLSLHSERSSVYITDSLHYEASTFDVHLGGYLDSGPKVAEMHVETKANCINGEIAAEVKVRRIELAGPPGR